MHFYLVTFSCLFQATMHHVDPTSLHGYQHNSRHADLFVNIFHLTSPPVVKEAGEVNYQKKKHPIEKNRSSLQVSVVKEDCTMNPIEKILQSEVHKILRRWRD